MHAFQPGLPRRARPHDRRRACGFRGGTSGTSRRTATRFPRSLPGAFRSRHTRRRPSTTSPRRASDILETLVAAALTLALTLGGGLQLISAAWARVFERGGYAHGIALISSVVVVSSAVDLPFSLYRTFVIEARFGFNRMTLRLFVLDLVKVAVLGVAARHPSRFSSCCGSWRGWESSGGSACGSYGWAFNLLVADDLSDVYRAAVQQVLAARGRRACARRIEALLAKCGFRAAGPVRHGRLEALEPRQRLLHRLRRGASASCSSTRWSRASPRRRSRRCSPTSSGHFSRHHVWKRIGVASAASLALLVDAGMADAAGLVLRGPGRARRRAPPWR